MRPESEILFREQLRRCADISEEDAVPATPTLLVSSLTESRSSSGVVSLPGGEEEEE